MGSEPVLVRDAQQAKSAETDAPAKSALSLCIICEYAPAVSEGFILTQACAFQSLGWQVTLLLGRDNAIDAVLPIWAERLAGFNVRIAWLPIARRSAPRSIFSRLRKVAATIARQNSEVVSYAEIRDWEAAIVSIAPDFVLVQFGQAAARVLPALTRSRVPFAVQFHGFDVTERSSAWGYRLGLKSTLAHSSVAFAPSRFLAERVRAVAGRKARIEVVGPGYDERVFDLHVVAPRPFSDRCRLITVGRLTAVKGHAITFAALARLPEATLTVVGEGEDKERLQQLAQELGVADRVAWLGWRSPDEIRNLFDQSDVFVQASRKTAAGAEEALGLSALEAAATGLPVVVSNSGGLCETCVDGETGFVFRAGDPNEAADRIRFLMARPDLSRQMGIAGARHARAYFASDIQARRADSVLMSILKKREHEC